MALPQGAIPSGESTIAVMQADNRKLVHTGLTKPSWMSIADQGALQFRKLWRSIVRRNILFWVDNSWSIPSEIGCVLGPHLAAKTSQHFFERFSKPQSNLQCNIPSHIGCVLGPNLAARTSERVSKHCLVPISKTVEPTSPKHITRTSLP